MRMLWKIAILIIITSKRNQTILDSLENRGRKKGHSKFYHNQKNNHLGLPFQNGF